MQTIIPKTFAEQPRFVPLTHTEAKGLGWDEIDILLVTGDAYVDHPAFGVPLLSRLLIAHGYRVGIVAQPAWEHPDSVAEFGRPRLFAGITAGALDSMLAHYTAFRKKRSDDAYTPGGLSGARPNRASLVYTNLVKRAFPGLPVVLGGIEASLRRIAHYDFWTDKIRRSILPDAKADFLLYGMAERGITALAGTISTLVQHENNKPQQRFNIPSTTVAQIPGAVCMGALEDIPDHAEVIRLPSYKEVARDPGKLLESSLLMEQHVHRGNAWCAQETDGRFVLLTPPAAPLATEEMDALYALPFTKRPHPSYTERIPAYDMIRHSITSHRGCGGGCSFCGLAAHQGRRIASRSRKSILQEAERLTKLPGWDGSITDIGGPSANMWSGRCTADPGECRRTSCLHPGICPKFEVDQKAINALLQAAAQVPGVSHVRVASGVRYDLALQNIKAAAECIHEFIGGQLKIAPEHITPHVLRLMRKPGPEVFEQFLEFFRKESRKAGKEQYVIPYLMSAFPGCSDADMRSLAQWLHSKGWRPRQVQCFIPLPGTTAAAMFHAGTDLAGEPISVAASDAQRLRQHGILTGTTRHDGGKPSAAGTSPGAARGRKKHDGHKKSPGKPQKSTTTDHGRKKEEQGKKKKAGTSSDPSKKRRKPSQKRSTRS